MCTSRRQEARKSQTSEHLQIRIMIKVNIYSKQRYTAEKKTHIKCRVREL